MVKYIETLQEFEAIVAKGGLVVIDFTATWCPPCRMIAPHFEAMAEDAANAGAEFYKVDVDAASEVAEKCGISAMPTFQFFKGGVKVDEMKGADIAGIKSMVAKHL